MIHLADDERMRARELVALEFYEKILAPDEEPGFVSDEANLLDISLASEEELIAKIKAHYGKTLTRFDLRRSFWRVLNDLNASDTKQESCESS